MRVHEFCFLTSVAAALCGMTLGIAMGMSQDFTLVPMHVHLNLLAWVSMALCGLYYRGSMSAGSRLAWTQAVIAAAGSWLFPLSLGVYLATGSRAAVPVVIGGSLLALLGMALFAAVVIGDVRRRASPVGHYAESG